jgi:hypothetical protein
MTQIPTTKADLLRALETEQDWWRTALDLAAQDGPLTGDEEIDANWTVKELVGHVSGWRDWTLARLTAAADGATKAVAPWPSDMHDDSEAGVDAINAWFKDQVNEQTLEEAVAHLQSQLDDLRAVVERIPDDDLLSPGRFTALDPQLSELPIGPALIGFSIAHVHIEHAPALQAWLTARLGQHVELAPTPSNFGYDE